MNKELLVRALSGSVYVLLIIFSLVSAHRIVLVFLLFSLFYFLSAFELSKLVRFRKPVNFLLFSVIQWFFIISASIYWTGYFPVEKEVALPVLYFFGSLYLIFPFIAKKDFIKNITGGLYIGLPFAATLFLVQKSPYLVLTVFILLWIYDTFAYLTGKSLGKHPLAPSVSPKKTLEGVAGGTLALFLFILLGNKLWFHYTGISPKTLYFLVPVVVFLGTLGDLFESKLKRQARLKDSGNIMPGHGGILDRLDSYYFVIIFLFFSFLYYAYLKK